MNYLSTDLLWEIYLHLDYIDLYSYSLGEIFFNKKLDHEFPDHSVSNNFESHYVQLASEKLTLPLDNYQLKILESKIKKLRKVVKKLESQRDELEGALKFEDGVRFCKALEIRNQYVLTLTYRYFEYYRPNCGSFDYAENVWSTVSSFKHDYRAGDLIGLYRKRDVCPEFLFYLTDPEPRYKYFRTNDLSPLFENTKLTKQNLITDYKIKWIS